VHTWLRRLVPLAILMALLALLATPVQANAHTAASSRTLHFTAYAATTSFRFVDADRNHRLSVGDYFVVQEKLYASLADLRAGRNAQGGDRVKCVVDRVRGSGRDALPHFNCLAVFTANDGSTLKVVASYWGDQTRFTGSVVSGTGQGQGATGKLLILTFDNYNIYKFTLVFRH
jgi:hypothetical protein